MAINPEMDILLVDDIQAMRSQIKGMLIKLGFRSITEAESGRMALATLNRQKVDFVITDWNMPGMSGYDLLIAIRDDSNLKHIPVLMVTAEASRERVVKAAEAGVNNYIVKPFDEKTLYEKIKNILK